MDNFNDALKLLNDPNLVWSEDFEGVRKNLSALMAKAWEMEYAGLEPELGNLALNLVRGQNARRPNTEEAT